MIAIIAVLVITIRKLSLAKVAKKTSLLSQTYKIKQFQRAYLAKVEFEQAKKKNKRAYNIALLLDCCQAPEAKSLLKRIIQNGGDSRTGKNVSPKSVYAPEVKNPFSKGEPFILGRYMYENDKSSKPIEWIIIDVRPDSILLLSRYVLDAKPFGENDSKKRTWAFSDVREWLNTTFYDTAFTDKEKVLIKQTEIKTFPSQSTAASGTYPKQPIASTDYDITKDRVFLLDKNEVDLIPDEYKLALATPYYESICHYCVSDYSVGDYSNHPKYARNWILRNLSYSPKYSSWWYPDAVSADGYPVKAIVEEISSIASDAAVRPAIIVSLIP